MCSLHRGYYGHYHTGTLLGHTTTGSRAPGPRPLTPWPGPRCGAGAGAGTRCPGWRRPLAVCGGGAGVHSVQASPATATLAGHQPPVCCDHRPLVWAMVCGGRARAQPSHQQVGLHHSTPPPPSGAPAPCPPPGHHLGTPPPRLITQCHVSPCHHWPGHVETLLQTYAYLEMLVIWKNTTFIKASIISYFLPKSLPPRLPGLQLQTASFPLSH